LNYSLKILTLNVKLCLKVCFQSDYVPRSFVVLEFCYNKHTFVKISGKVCPSLTWHISQIRIDYFFSNYECLCFELVSKPLVVEWCIAFCNKNVFEIEERSKNPVNLSQFDRWWFWGCFLLASNMKKEVLGVLESFNSFSRKHDAKKTHNTLSLMLGPRFKNICLMPFCIGHKKVWLLLRNTMKDPYIPCLSNNIIIFIQC
jgi:hypothetical protein